ncbi:hypothetical protein [Pseudoalteromonas rubra]|uniref:hypothetical protein n=1 Tax=Pseudoalteromonas rubra TaxID=43658 RepID=UPI000F7A62F6|nr:hypothetical protein [Pseudoalteromonas rubra]
MKLQRKILSGICFFVIIGILINGYLIRGQREFTEPFWVSGTVTSVDCASSNRGIHMITINSFEEPALVTRNTIECKELDGLIGEEISVKISYGYETVPYSYELKVGDSNYRSKNEVNSESQYSKFSNFESLIMMFLSVIMFMTLIYKERES